MSTVLYHLLTFGLLSRGYCVNGCQGKKQRGGTIERSKIHRVHLTRGLRANKAHKTFLECLDASLRDADDPGEPETDCQNCKKPTRKRKSDKFVELPKILLTMFSRNSQNRNNRKRETDCPLPPTFIPTVDRKYRGKRGKYRIVGVVSHQGHTGNAGHNISYVPNHAEPGEWYRIDDSNVTPLEFRDINRFVAGKRSPQQLPYIIAWELIDASIETAEERKEGEVARATVGEEGKQQLDDRDTALNARETELDGKFKALEAYAKELGEKGKALEIEERKWYEKEKDVNLRENELNKKEKGYTEKERILVGRAVALYREKIEFTKKEKALKEREEKLDAEKENNLVNNANSSSNNHHIPPPGQPDVGVTEPAREDVDDGKDTTTFCASFWNTDNHEESARATFKLKNFNPNAPTKIESTVQLSDLEGNLRSIKRGTAVNDEFTIIFNVKASKKRKRGNDNEAASSRPRTKKSKGPAERGDRRQIPPRVSQEPPKPAEVGGGPPGRTASQTEPESPTISKERQENCPPPPRRSTRANKGQRSKIA